MTDNRLSPNRLSPFEKSFINHYISNGYNGTRAYLAVRPQVTVGTAAVSSSELLNNPKIIAELDRREERRVAKNLYSRENLTAEAYEIAQQAKKDNNYNSALKGIELTGKLQHLYDTDTPELGGYQTLIQALVNVNIGTNAPLQVVEGDMGVSGGEEEDDNK